MVLKLVKFNIFRSKTIWALFFVAGLAFADAIPQPAPVPSTSPLVSIDSKNLLREFKKAQRSELLSLEHQQKMGIKELKASQEHRFKEWKNAEKEKRHHYFQENLQGIKRREFMQDFYQRREGLLNLIKEERSQRLIEHGARHKAIQADQEFKAQKFKEYLDRGEQPPRELWP